jgi:hypothetical protein
VTAAGHVDRLEALLGCQIFTHVVVNIKPPTPQMLANYAKEGEKPVTLDPAEFENRSCELIQASLLSDDVRTQNPADLLERTVLRHDPEATGDMIMELLLRARRRRQQEPAQTVAAR